MRRLTQLLMLSSLVAGLMPARSAWAQRGEEQGQRPLPEDYGAEFNIPQDQLPRPLYEQENRVEGQEEAPEPAPSSGWLNFAPSAAIGASFSFTDEELDKPGLAIWLGCSYYPKPSRITPFIGAGLQIEAYYELEVYPIDYIPTVKVGGAWLHGNPNRFYNQTFAYMHVYALGGYRRSVMDERDGAWRMGLGVSSPVMSPAAAFMLLYGVPVPTQLELLVDARQANGITQRDWWLQLGIGF